MRNDKISVGIATSISGAISGATLTTIPGTMWFGPGLLFGLATAYCLHAAHRWNVLRCVIWIAASVGAWYAAIQSYIRLDSNIASAVPDDTLLPMLAAGILGALILTIVFAVLDDHLDPIRSILTVAAGPLLAIVMYWITGLPGSDSSSSLTPLILAFAIWQAGVGISLLTLRVKQT